MRRLWRRIMRALTAATTHDLVDVQIGVCASIALAMALLLGGCAAQLYSDPGPKAVEAGDLTALLAGCGKSTPTGSLYCRFAEG